MSKIQVPKVMFISGGGSGAGGEMDVMKNMINYKLLLETGVLDKTNVNISTVDRKVQR